MLTACIFANKCVLEALASYNLFEKKRTFLFKKRLHIAISEKCPFLLISGEEQQC